MADLVNAAGRYALKPQLERAPFESLARAIAHQQLNGVVAGRILARLCALFPEVPFPAPPALLATPAEALRAVGFSFAKIRALHDLAAKTVEGVVPPGEELHALDDEAIIERLSSVRGIGRWTVEMLLMFQLGRPDVWPVDDFGVRNGFRLAYGLPRMPTPRALREFGERWRPHRSAVAWYLWRAVDLHRAGKLPRPRRPAPRIVMQKPARRKKPAVGKKARA
jgi:DNA-3-methyladenine glycosylase II